MTENEKNFLIENARIRHAAPHIRPKTAKGKKSIAFIISGTAVLALWCCPDTSPLTDAAALICRTAAAAELCPEFLQLPPTPVNEIRNNVNTSDVWQISPGDELMMISRGSRRMPSSANEDIMTDELLPPPVSDTDSGTDDHISSDKIVPITYEKGKGDNYIDLPLSGQIRNVTDLSSDEILSHALEKPDFAITLNAPENQPQVLIMHTHTTESYQQNNHDPDYTYRTTDSSLNMTAVGDAMADTFEKMGIRVYHDTTVHDHPSYNGSYDRSRVTVEEILQKHPSIKVVLDVHRDAIERDDGSIIAPTAVIGRKTSAQVMLICGCDDGTMNMPNCMKNLSTAAFFQQSMESTHNGLTRPVLFDYRHYNQDMTTGSLLLEVGGHGNTLEEAIYAGELAAEGIAEALIQISEISM